MSVDGDRPSGDFQHAFAFHRLFPRRYRYSGPAPRGGITMASTVWKGHVSFGMVCFPVKLCAAARSQTVTFHQLHHADHSRVKQVLYCQAEDQPVPRSELVKGFEYEKDRYVILEERDLARAEPRTARVLE